MNRKNEKISVEEIQSGLFHFMKANIVDKAVICDVDTSFQELKIDSLSMVEMILFLERKYSISIPETELIPENFKSVKVLAACAHRCLRNEG